MKRQARVLVQRIFVGLGLVPLALAACADHPTDPAFDGPAVELMATGTITECPTPPTVVVSDQAGLLAALAAAVPGTVIGIDGMIPMTQGVPLFFRNGLTFTCATPGSGITRSPFGLMFAIVGGSNITMDRLVLDGGFHAVQITGNATDISVTNNVIRRYASAAVLASAPLTGGQSGHVYAGNYVDGTTPPFPQVAFQTQNGPRTDMLITRNTLVGQFTFVRAIGVVGIGASRHTISHNVIMAGPQRDAIHIIGTDHLVEHNRSFGAGQLSLRVQGDGHVVRNNIFTGAAIAGIGVGFRSGTLFPPFVRACFNTFVGNNLQGNAGGVGALFSPASGANQFVGNGQIVGNDGAFDCDGDGVIDPNAITGAGAIRGGLALGGVLGADPVLPTVLPEEVVLPER